MENSDTGLLLSKKDIELHRSYFRQMTRLIGINVVYRAPREGKEYDGYGELDSFYDEPMVIGVIFEEHPTQRTMRKLGWNSELQEEASVIFVPYDTPGLQRGSLFVIPSHLDKTEGRLFTVTEMTTSSIYPSSVACRIAPVWKSTFERSQLNHEKDNFNLIKEEERDW